LAACLTRNYGTAGTFVVRLRPNSITLSS